MNNELEGKQIIGLVPTMGALHAGHISLVKLAKEKAQTVVVCIFVNPAQFNESSDYDNYPKTIENDKKMLKEAQTDIVFIPSVEQVYPVDLIESNYVHSFGPLVEVMEGSHRPGHFAGMAKVVQRLFEIVKPQYAVFGKKDFQQLLIVRNLVAMLDMPVEVIGAPIAREKDGLAMSSRNLRLSDSERSEAGKINVLMKEAARKLKAENWQHIHEWFKNQIATFPSLRLEYFDLVSGTTLQEIKNVQEDDNPMLFIGIFAGPVRLIDNFAINEL